MQNVFIFGSCVPRDTINSPPFKAELHPEEDNFHMNDDFGELWLLSCIQKLIERSAR